MRALLTEKPLPAQPAWFEAWFDSPYYEALYAHRDDAEAGAFVDHPGRLAAADRWLDGPRSGMRHRTARQASRFQRSSCSGPRPVREQHPAGETGRATEPLVPASGHAAAIRPRRVRVHPQPLHDLRLLRRACRAPDRGAQHRTGAEAGRAGGPRLPERPYAERHLIAEEVVDREGVVYRISRWTDPDHILKRIVSTTLRRTRSSTVGACRASSR